MADHQRALSQRGDHHSSTSGSRHVVKFLTAGTIGASMLGLSGLTMTGTTIALVVVTPLLVIFSPVIVPAAITVFLITSGFLLSGALGMSSMTALTWLYKYVSGKHPPGADQLDYAKDRLAETAKDVKEKAKEYGQYVQQKATEVTHSSP